VFVNFNHDIAIHISLIVANQDRTKVKLGHFNPIDSS
jgi:hypothetical protein